MAKYQVTNKKLGVHFRTNRQKVQIPVLMVCLQCRVINALAKNRWQSSKGRAVFSFGKRLACGSVCVGTDCASRNAGTVRIRF
jgi:hypothetical protein